MEIKTKVQNGNVNFLQIDPGETLIVKFAPDGYNATDGSYTVRLTIKTTFTPDGKMGLSIELPKDRTYKTPDGTLVLHDNEGYEKLAFKQGDDIESIIELERFA